MLVSPLWCWLSCKDYKILTAFNTTWFEQELRDLKIEILSYFKVFFRSFSEIINCRSRKYHFQKTVAETKFELVCAPHKCSPYTSVLSQV